MRVAGVVLVLLFVAEAAFGGVFGWLPIGGSHLMQTAIVFGCAFAVVETVAMIGRR